MPIVERFRTRIRLDFDEKNRWGLESLKLQVKPLFTHLPILKLEYFFEHRSNAGQCTIPAYKVYICTNYIGCVDCDFRVDSQCYVYL